MVLPWRVASQLEIQGGSRDELASWRRRGQSVIMWRSIATDPGQPLSVTIPLHILESIFAHLSIQDIMNCSLVCARWSAICRREKVSIHELLALVYVSLYYRLLHSSCFGRRATWKWREERNGRNGVERMVLLSVTLPPWSVSRILHGQWLTGS